MSQESLILKYLQAGNRLTPLDALRLFSCLRLGARIFQLKKQGHDIKMELHKDGYAVYSISGDSRSNTKDSSSYAERQEDVTGVKSPLPPLFFDDKGNSVFNFGDLEGR